MNDKRALIASLATAMMWALTGVLIKSVPSLSPMVITGARLAIGLLAVLPLVAYFPAARKGLRSALFNLQAYKLAVLMVAYYVLATAAFQTAPVAEVALLISTSPLFVLIFRRIKGAIPTRNELVGAVIAFAGLAIIFIPKMNFIGTTQSSHLLGQLLSLGAAVVTALYAFLYRSLAGRPSSPDTLSVSLLTFIVGNMILGLLLGLGSSTLESHVFDVRTLVVLVSLGVLCTAVPTVGFAFAAKHLPALVTATISLLVPFLAGILAYFMLGERLSPTFIPGGIFVILGIVLILRKGQETAHHER